MAETKQALSSWRYLATLWCMLETFCFGGLHFGWASLVYVLKQEGFFGDDCEKFNETLSTKSKIRECDDQDKQLSLLYSVGNGLSVIPAFLCGTSLSRFGPVKTRVVYAILFITGCVFMIASSSDIPWLACVGIMLLAGSGKVFLLTNMQISKLYTSGSFIIIAVLNGCYDSSSAITLFIKGPLLFNPFLFNPLFLRPSDEVGIGMRVSFTVILCLCLTTFLNTYWRFYRIIPGEEKRDGDTTENNSESVPRLTIRTLYRTYAFSDIYISHFVWFSLIAIHFMFFISASNIYIQDVVQAIPETGESSLTNFMSIVLLLGVVPALLIGVILELSQFRMKGTVYIRNLKTSLIGFITTSLLSISMAVLSIFYIKPLVYLVFVIMAIMRAFLFAMAYSFVAKANKEFNRNCTSWHFSKRFPDPAFGALSAIIDVQVCLLLLIQRALVQWLKTYDDASFHIRIFLISLGVLSMLHPVLVYLKARRAEQEERRKREQNARLGEVLTAENYDSKSSAI